MNRSSTVPSLRMTRILSLASSAENEFGLLIGLCLFVWTALAPQVSVVPTVCSLARLDNMSTAMHERAFASAPDLFGDMSDNHSPLF